MQLGLGFASHIGWESGARFVNQSHSKEKQNQSKSEVLSQLLIFIGNHSITVEGTRLATFTTSS